MRLRHLLLVLLAVLAFATDAAADASVPDSALTLWVVGRAHLSFTVAITNPTGAPATFDGTGLYFLPTAKADEPQRLGVVTPGHLASGTGAAEAWNGISVPPHATIQVTLTSYCLDSNRPGPQETTQYRLATARLPSPLADSLAREARSLANGSQSSQTQAAVWRIRSQTPTALMGDTH